MPAATFASLLRAVGASEIGQPLSAEAVEAAVPSAASGPALSALLSTMNGFYAYSEALHVFPVTDEPDDKSLARWNDSALWRAEYGELARDLVFFGEDVFGDQFAMRVDGQAVLAFNAETGDVERVAGSLEEWFHVLLNDGEFLTGRPIAERWREVHGPLARGTRLLPVTPFVLGGSYELDNLRAVDAVDGMCFRGQLARQLAGLADGTSVRIVVD